MAQYSVKRYYDEICEQLQKTGLTPNSGKTSHMTADEFRHDCRDMTEKIIQNDLQAEVKDLDKIVAANQERYNLVGSVGKAFYEETEHGKQYKYLSIESAILHFCNGQERFMDWLLEHRCYMNFSKVLPAYIEHLKKVGHYALIVDKIVYEVCHQFMKQE